MVQWIRSNVLQNKYELTIPAAVKQKEDTNERIKNEKILTWVITTIRKKLPHLQVLVDYRAQYITKDPQNLRQRTCSECPAKECPYYAWTPCSRCQTQRSEPCDFIWRGSRIGVIVEQEYGCSKNTESSSLHTLERLGHCPKAVSRPTFHIRWDCQPGSPPDWGLERLWQRRTSFDRSAEHQEHAENGCLPEPCPHWDTRRHR